MDSETAPDNHIRLDDCKDGGLYKILSRNLLYGVFREATQGFVGIREKFGQRCLFEEYHYEAGAPYGTVTHTEFLDLCPIGPVWYATLSDRA